MTSILTKLYVNAKTFSIRDEEGQVAAEYMGLVALAAFIIFGLITQTDIDGVISSTVERLVNAISNGTDPGSGAGGGGGGGGGPTAR